MNGLICASLGSSSDHVLKALEQLDPIQEMAEVRIDLLEDYDSSVEVIFSKASELGISTIATVREIKADPGFSKTRSDLMKRCIRAGCTYCDIEVEAPVAYQQELVELAKQQSVLVIISHHDYAVEEKSSEGLEKVIDECFAKGADLAKVAVAVRSVQGAARVLGLYNTTNKVVAIGMGEFGKTTRVAAITLGAPFSFAAWDATSATAPGQLTRDQMKSALTILGWSGDVSRNKRFRH